MSKKTIALLFITVAFLVYFPVLLFPSFLVGRNNDLQEFFWPIIYFVKNQITQNHAFPLWNNLFFSGTPLLPDPQSPLFYPPNIVFLVFPIDAGFIVSLLLHSLVGGAGIYLTTKRALGFSQTASIISAILYMATPRLAGAVEAGHFGLAQSFAWPPFVLFGLASILNGNSTGLFILALGFAGLFYTHTVSLLVILAISIMVFCVGLIFFIKPHLWLKRTLAFAIAGFIALGTSAITLLPQIEWLPQTTRFMLLADRDVYPKWSGKEEFVKMALLPWLDGTKQIWNVDSEKWIPLGFVTVVLAFLGFWKLPSRFKVPVILVLLFLIMISLNNTSPLYNLLLSQDWYVLMRVATRVWPVVILTVILLAGFGINYLWTNKPTRKLSLLISVFAIAEVVLLSWVRLATPVMQNPNAAPQEIYDFLKKDQGQFRVFCVTRCLSQKKAAEARLELAEGYGTLQQKNYYNAAIQLYQIYWNRYTLSIPPTELYSFREIQPYAPALALFNIKYVIAPYELHDKRLVEEKRAGKYIIYKNTIAKSRAYFLNNPKDQAEILKYSPNNIKVRTQDATDNQLILAEIFSPGWKAYLNGSEETVIKETPDSLRVVTIKPDTKFVDFRYEPKSYTIGKAITFTTIIILVGILLNKWKISYNLLGKKNSF